MSRELDINVADILGWTSSPVSPPCYSTDYAALPEMLAWLRSKGYGVQHWGREDCSSETEEWEAEKEGEDIRTVFAKFAEWPDAVARLVVAVAEAQR